MVPHQFFFQLRASANHSTRSVVGVTLERATQGDITLATPLAKSSNLLRQFSCYEYNLSCYLEVKRPKVKCIKSDGPWTCMTRAVCTELDAK